MVIYIDVLFIVNLYIDYLLLLLTAGFLHLYKKPLRLLLGAAAGACSACVLLLLPMPGALSFLGALASSLLLVAAAFCPLGRRSFFKAAGVFYAQSFLLAGILSLMARFFFPQALYVAYGSVYINISMPLLFALTCAAYFILSVCGKIIGTREDTRSYIKLRIRAQSHEVTLLVKVDTGNSLREPFSGLPVLVADRDAVRDILPPLPLNWQQGACPAGIRLVPFETVGATGLLPAFRPVQIWDCAAQKELTAYLAVCAKGLHAGYAAIINPDALENSMPSTQKKTAAEPGSYCGEKEAV